MAALRFDSDSLPVIIAMCGVLGFAVCTLDPLIDVIERGVREVQSGGHGWPDPRWHWDSCCHDENQLTMDGGGQKLHLSSPTSLDFVK